MYLLSLDLTVVLSQLTFIPDGGHQICTDVMIASNDGLEDEETFHLTLDSSDSDRIIVGPPATTSILITDTDGNQNFYDVMSITLS